VLNTFVHIYIYIYIYIDVFNTLFPQREEFRAEFALQPDSNVYCTGRSRDVKILVKLDKKKTNCDHFVLTHVLVKAPERNFTSPIGSGSIYIHSDADSIHQDEDSYCCSFNLQDKQYCTLIELQTPRWGKYITIHLAAPRSRSEGNNIDIQYVGFKGYWGKHCFSSGSLL